MGNINICLSCDENYAKHAAVVMASVLKNATTNDDIVFHILDGGIAFETKEKIRQLSKIKDCGINFIKISDELFNDYKNVKTHSYITLPTFYRLKLPSLLPDVSKIVYFDCDFVICTSLKELYETDIHNNLIAGVLDANRHKVKENPTYINAGMILFDLEKMRKENIEDKFLNWTIQNLDKIELGDQEIINEVLKGKIEIVDSRWNVQSSDFINRSSYTRNPHAIHLIAKPWKFARGCYHKKEYFKYLQLTEWKLNKNEYKYWTSYNQFMSIIKYIQNRPFFWVRYKFYRAFYCTYLKRQY